MPLYFASYEIIKSYIFALLRALILYAINFLNLYLCQLHYKVLQVFGMIDEEPLKSWIEIGDKRRIGSGERCFIIAEIGQNHQGDLKIAKEMIKLAKECGADCVKLQKSDLHSKFNGKALLRPYSCSNSWGSTYGEHKAYLEFSQENFIQLQKYAAELDILFSASAMDNVSLNFLNSINVPFIKIGSGDFHNRPLLLQAAKLHKPLIISTGMSNIEEVIDVYNTIKTEHSKFCLLHCTSSYPTPLNEVNLNVIKSYKKLFPDIPIGYSGHELGFEIAIAAVLLGAKIIEKHFTLNKNWKGSDHICSLDPKEFKEMVDGIRNYETSKNSCLLSSSSVKIALGDHIKKFQNCEMACFEKLGKTIVAAKDIKKGDAVDFENVCVKVAEPKGIPAKEFNKIMGKIVNRDIEANESLFQSDLI